MDRTVIPDDCAKLLHQLVQLCQRNSSYLETTDFPTTLDTEITEVLHELVKSLSIEPEPVQLGLLARQHEAALVGLTRRERDVLCWLAKGKSVSDIGVLMQISKCTVRTYIQRSLKKLDVSNRTHAVSQALRFGLIEL